VARPPFAGPSSGSPRLTAEALFDRVAPRYDATNAALSFGLHGAWRDAAVRALAPRDGERVLDLCAGTLDLAAAIHRAAPGARVVAADRSHGMLACGLGVRPCAAAAQACAQALPFAGHSFDAACIGYGIRNIPDRARALAELRRVLRPGGRLAILEFVSPRGALARTAHAVSVRFLVPFVGGLVGSDPSAYRYLARSIEAFLDLEGLAALVEGSGFRVLERRLLPPRGPAALVLAETRP
jgi:demethylmenaquinone methyltransferase/2-methoxy-6-polyprenyl-1,4-benzoquinol methylase